MISVEEQRAALKVEIFKTTGVAVDERDPAIMFALLQAELMRRTGDEIVAQIDRAKADALASLDTMLQEKSEQLAKQVSQQIVSSVQQFTDAETERARGKLSRMAASLRSRLDTAVDSSTIEQSTGLSTKVIGVLAAVIGISALLAAICFSPLSQTQREQLELGQRVLKVLPTLDAKTRQNLVSAITNVKI